MKHIGAKLNMYVSSVMNAGIMRDDMNRIMFRFVFWSFGALAVLYVLILGNMVKNIIQRQNLEINARALSSEVGNLELSYLSLSNSIDLPLSYSLGFKEIHPTFTTRKTLGLKTSTPSVGNIKTLQNDI
jgi:hypothetical protein